MLKLPKINKKLPLISLISLIIFLILIGGLVLYRYPLQILINNIKTVFLRSDFFEKSTAKVSLEDNALNLKFNLLPKDKDVANKFLSNAKLPTDILSGVSIEVDSSTSATLAPFLPTEISLLISPKVVTFFSNHNSSLLSSDLSKSFEYATGSALLKYNKVSESQFKLQIKNPAELLKTAINQGKIRLSNKSSGLMLFLHKVSTIRLEVNGKHVDGEIILK